jgi:EAL domain-containing protein (putative c-di-GMP-specific phosphodiesterase class I)
MISPAEFIAIAEDTGLIISIGEWVMHQACLQLSLWQQQFKPLLQPDSFKMNVNVSNQQFQDSQFIDKFDRILASTGIDGNCLRLEITETALMDSTETTQTTLKQIKQRKAALSIDDFGTGYSSLSYLHRFPIDTLKIDRSFIMNMNDDAENLEIVRTIIALAQSLSMEVIAEGVETLEQQNQLKSLGCQFAQGYLFAKPQSAQAVSSMLPAYFNWGNVSTPFNKQSILH